MTGTTRMQRSVSYTTRRHCVQSGLLANVTFLLLVIVTTTTTATNQVEARRPIFSTATTTRRGGDRFDLPSKLVRRRLKSSPVNVDDVLVALRGGGSSSSSSSPLFGRTPAKPTNHPFTASSQQTERTFDASSATTEDQVTTKEMLDSFLTRDSRNTFIARVYAILAGQLLVTGLSVVLFGTQPALRHWMIVSGGKGALIPGLSLLVSTISWFVICSSVEARRKSPRKWWLLTAFTIGEAISVGFISSFYKYKSVVSAMVATILATLTVSLYTILQKNPKHDLSQWGAGLSSCAMIFLVYGVIGLLQTVGIIPANFLPYNDAIYSGLGACLFSLYLAHHTKLIVSGKHSKYQMSDKDYVFGAMTLYNDIINMFIYILRVLGEDRDQ